MLKDTTGAQASVARRVVADAFHEAVGLPIHDEQQFGHGFQPMETGRYIEDHPDPSRLVEMRLSLRGRLETLHLNTYSLTFVLDPDLDADATRTTTLAQLRQFLDQERARRDLAHEMGLGDPLPPDATSHLLVDRDAMATLSHLLDGRAAAHAWLAGHIPYYAEHGGTPPGLHVDGLRVSPALPLVAGVPTIPLIEDRWGNMLGSLWSGAHLQLVQGFPQTVVAVLPGRRVDDVIEGLPIGRRRIVTAGSSGMLSRFGIETDDVPFTI